MISRPVSFDLSEPPLDDAALQRKLAELREMDKKQLQIVNLSVVDVVSASLAAAVQIERLLPQLTQLGSFNLELATSLEAWAYVLQHVDTQVRQHAAPARFSAALRDEAFQLRRSLKQDANHLALRGIINDERLGQVSSSKRLTKLASDLLLLTHILRDTQSAWTGKSPVTEAQLDSAKAVAKTLQRELQQRVQFDRNPWQDLRVRAFTMVRRAHAEARAAVLYLLRDDPDADRVIPALAHRRYRTARRRGVENFATRRGALSILESEPPKHQSRQKTKDGNR